MPSGFWGWFYVCVVLLTWFYSILKPERRAENYQTVGAEVICLTFVASMLAREVSNNPTPFAMYAVIDLSAGAAFWYLASRSKAVWALFCVALHSIMLMLHLAAFIYSPSLAGDYYYISFLNFLFLLSLITINGAIYAGRSKWGVLLDRFVDRHLRGWSWSGMVEARHRIARKRVA